MPKFVVCLYVLLFLIGLYHPLVAKEISQMRFTSITAEDGLCDNHVMHILQLPDNRMLFTTSGNINVYDGVQFRHIHRTDIAPYYLMGYRGAYHVYVDMNHKVWIKTSHHLMCFDLERNEYVRDIPSLFNKKWARNSDVTDLFVDSEYGLWLVSDGLVWCENTNRTIVLQEAWGELQDIDVLAGKGYLFFSTGKVVCVDVSSSKVDYVVSAFDEGQGEAYSWTSMVVKSSDGKFYQLRNGSRGIFLCFSPEERQWKKLLESDEILHTLAVKDSSILYFTSTEGLWRYDTRDSVVTLEDSLTLANGETVDAASNTIFFDRQGGAWIGTYSDGLLYAHPSRFLFSTIEDGNIVWPQYKDVYEDSRGYRWTPTTDGLLLEYADRKRMIYSEDGLSNDYIYSIVEDARHRVWVSTANGLSCVVVYDIDSIDVMSYDVRDGVMGGEFVNGHAMLTPDGRIVMEGKQGLVAFSPDEVVKMDCLNLSPLLTGMTVNGERYNYNVSGTSLAYDQNTLSFDFSALNYAQPHRTWYRYTLCSGNDSTVMVVRPGNASGAVDRKGALHVTLLSLSPGNYTLHVEAAVDARFGKGVPASIAFEIRKPWWHTWWAYSIYALSFIAVITFIVVSYLSNQRRKVERRVKEERLMARIEGLIEQCSHYETRLNTMKEEEKDLTKDKKGNDSDFLQRAIALVEQNINSQYSVEQLSRDLCMERTGLYKRLSALIDQSPSVFIRSIRLRHAAELIKSGELTIAEIAERTGFSSSSYLSRCFQEEYGCKPSEYARK